MSVHRITLDLDDDEYSAIVNSLQEYEADLRHQQAEDDRNGIDHSGRQQDIDMVAELIAKIEEATDNGELVSPA